MNRLRGGLALLVVALATWLASCGDGGPLAPAVASPDAMDAVAQEGTPASPVRPMHGTTAGMLVGLAPGFPDFCPAERPLLVTYQGEGRFTHLGNTSVQGTECLFMDPSNPATAESGEGRFVLTAANGDELRVAYDRTVLEFEAPPSPWVLWSAEIRADGGTGRFANAELVDAAWSGGLNLATYETWSIMDGSIRY